MASASSLSAGDSKRFSGYNFPSNLRHSQTARPSSPQTPHHQLSSNNSSFASTSSGSSFRSEEDAIIFELGSRWLRAGFEGESTPMCTVGFGPEESRRTGDYRGWLNYGPSTERSVSPEEWANPYELWGMNLRKVDLGLVEDKIERVVRETYNKYLLTDAGTTRLVLVMPSLMPHQLLASVLSTLFNRWRFPSITLLPAAAMSATAAGVRSAMVVDLGWAETTVTGVYEYREVAHKRSTRAMKHLLQETGRFLTHLTSPSASTRDPTTDELSVNFEYCEEVVTRFAWCKTHPETEQTDLPNTTISIPSPSNPGSEYIDIPFPKLAEPVEKALFAHGIPEFDLDDEEKPLPLLLYNTLLALAPDARGMCMSRIIFVGGGSHIPGIRQRILNEVNALIKTHGWTQVRGKAVERQRTRLQNLSLTPMPNLNPNPSSTTPSTGTTTPTQEPTATASHTPSIDDEGDNEIDFVEQKLQRNRDRDFKPPVQGVLREVESLGPWAGASLVTSLKIRGMVEIEREKYLQHGLAGASRDLEHGYVPDRRSGLRTGGDRSSWTLAGWG